jgi:uncharacterized protein
MPTVQPIEDTTDTPAVRGYLHTPDAAAGMGLVLAHGAGSNANAPMLVAVAEVFAAAGITVLRIDLPFRQARPRGSPFPAVAAQDRAGIKRAAQFLRERAPGRVYIGGHSYGGRQASMLAAEEPDVAAGLLLFSYPLHAPGRSDLRSAHFARITRPALFVHGTRDPFGSIDEMRSALALLGGPHELIPIEGARHDLGPRAVAAGAALAAFSNWLAVQ